MDEKEVAQAFGDDYSQPVNDWYTEERLETIELKLSRQSQILLGLGVGLGVTLFLSVLNGKITIRLANGHKLLIEAFNTLVEPPPNAVSYTAPAKEVDLSQAEPTNEELLREMQKYVVNDDPIKFDPEA